MNVRFFQMLMLAMLVSVLTGCVQTTAIKRIPVQTSSDPSSSTSSGQTTTTPINLPLPLSMAAQNLQQPDGTDNALETAVTASLDHVAGQPASEVAVYLPVVSDSYSPTVGNQDGLPGQIAVTYADMQTVLQHLQTVLPAMETQGAVLQSEFRWVLVGTFGFTGYYEPIFQASHTPSGPFQVPLYSAWRNSPLAWVSGSLDSAIMQLQGSGQLDFQDGSQMYVEYSGVENPSGLSVRQILAANDLMPDLKNMKGKVRDLRTWIAEHPKAQQAILRASDPHRVFTPASYGPRGSMGSILTPWVSLATDQTILPNGLVTVIDLIVPDIGHFQGIMLPQDSGGGIIGNRIDVFCGSGYTAEQWASSINTSGSVYVLLPKVK